MSFVTGLQYRECDQDYLKTCCMSARLTSVPLGIVYDYDVIANRISHEEIATRDKDLRRYRALLPIDEETQVGTYSGFNGTDLINAVKPTTIASSIAVGNPAGGCCVVHAIKESGGWGESVTDKEIVEGIELLARTEEISSEPAGRNRSCGNRKLIQGRIRVTNQRY